MTMASKMRLTRAYLEEHGYKIHQSIMAQHSNIVFTYVNLRCETSIEFPNSLQSNVFWQSSNEDGCNFNSSL